MSEANGPVDLAIVGVGMVSAAGFQAAECVATVRASMAQFIEMPAVSRFLQEEDRNPTPGEPATAMGGAVPGLADDVPRGERCLRLAEHALRQAMEAAAAGRELPAKTALLVASPVLAGPDLGERLAAGLPGPAVASEKIAPSHAAALAGLVRAARLLADKQVDLCFVGGVDSWMDRELLFALNRQRRLKHSKSLEGFVPGEAAGFLAVTTPAAARARGQKVLCRITGLALAEEKVSADSDEACRGVGLAEAIHTAVGSLFNTTRIDLIVCDLNGEPYRHEEWAAALPKCVSVSPEEFRLWHPADCIGDIGAASAATHLVLAALGLAADVTRRREALVWGSSENGLRGAALLARAND